MESALYSVMLLSVTDMVSSGVHALFLRSLSGIFRGASSICEVTLSYLYGIFWAACSVCDITLYLLIL